MKKMIVIAALIGGMLMPAQIMAQKNNRNEKPRIENRDNRKEFKARRGGFSYFLHSPIYQQEMQSALHLLLVLLTLDMVVLDNF